MAQIKITTTIEITWDDGTITTEFDKTRTITGLKNPVVKSVTIPADGTQVVWDPSLSGSPDFNSKFDFLALIADGILDVEGITGDANNDADTRVGLSGRLTQDLPLMLGADESYDGALVTDGAGANIAFDTPDDVIDKLRVNDPAATAREFKAIIAEAV